MQLSAMGQTAWRTLVGAALLAYAAAVGVILGGQWVLSHPTAENLRRGVDRFPRNPQIWTAYAYQWILGPESSDPGRAAEAFLRAARLNPSDPLNWEGLATAYTQMNDPARTEAALRSELIAVPNSPKAAWRFANFLLLRGRQNEALPYVRVAAASDPALRPAVFQLGWKILGEPEAVLRDIVPASVEARSAYLSFLIDRNKLLEGYQVWRMIRPARTDSVVELGYKYAEGLASTGLGAKAASVWDDVLSDVQLSWIKPAGELLTNGDFEADLGNVGLHWRFATGPGFEVQFDRFVVQTGSRSLRVTFDGSSNLDFAGVSQWVPVEPNRHYRLSGYLKTEKVTSDSAVRFSVSTPFWPREESLLLYSPGRVGTSPWSLEELHFRTGPRTTVVVVALRRLPSRKLINTSIAGTVWIDNLSLRSLTD